MERARTSKVLSNAAFLIPGVISCIHGIFPMAALALTVAIASSAYHLSEETRYRTLDVAAALSLVAANIVLIVSSGLRQPYAALAFAALAVALFFFYVRSKDDWEWHVSSACITLLCTLAYAEAEGSPSLS